MNLGSIAVILDRISQDIPFYRAYLKKRCLAGDDRHQQSVSGGRRMTSFLIMLWRTRWACAIPPTAILPHHKHPPDTTDQSMRNLIYPLNWDELFAYVGFPAFLKPYAGGGWKHVYKVHSPDEFFSFL